MRAVLSMRRAWLGTVSGVATVGWTRLVIMRFITSQTRPASEFYRDLGQRCDGHNVASSVT